MTAAARQRGFVLAATLWFLAALVAAAGFIALWSQGALKEAEASRSELRGRLDILGTRGTLLYFAATQPMSFGGIVLQSAAETPAVGVDPDVGVAPTTVLALDGRVYAGMGTARFALQDEGGLISLSAVSERRLGYLLGLLGIPAEERGPLEDKLLDYADADDFYRLNGGEAPQYRELRLPPPPNRLLLSPQEVRRVLGWRRHPEVWEDPRFLESTTVTWSGVPVINTAPPLVLQTLAGLDAEGVRRIVAERAERPFRSAFDLLQRTQVRLREDPMDLLFFPSQNVRVTLWYNGSFRMERTTLALTPNAVRGGPWELKTHLELPLLEAYAVAPPVTAPVWLFPSETLLPAAY